MRACVIQLKIYPTPLWQRGRIPLSKPADQLSTAYAIEALNDYLSLVIRLRGITTR